MESLARVGLGMIGEGRSLHTRLFQSSISDIGMTPLTRFMVQQWGEVCTANHRLTQHHGGLHTGVRQLTPLPRSFAALKARPDTSSSSEELQRDLP
jgi:hypothetical protein